jgi:hypothetical protein
LSAYRDGKIMEGILARMDSFQEEMRTNQEMVARMEAKMDVNLKEKKEGLRTNQAKSDTTRKEMKEELMARLEAKIEAEINTNSDKFEVLQSTVVSWMDIH